MRTGLKKTKAPKAKRSAVVVECYLRVSSDNVPGNSGSRILAPAKMIEQIQGGLSVRELEALRDSLDVPMEKLAPKLGISNATVHRRKAQGRLRPAESERVVRLARLTGKAAKVLGGGRLQAAQGIHRGGDPVCRILLGPKRKEAIDREIPRGHGEHLLAVVSQHGLDRRSPEIDADIGHIRTCGACSTVPVR